MEWHKTKYKGVRYREHPTRKYGVGRDRYFMIRYQRDHKRVEEVVGWASEGWAAERVALVLAELKEAYLLGKQKPTTLSERREAEKQRQEAEKKGAELAEKEKITFGQYFREKYPDSEVAVRRGTAEKRKGHFRKWIEPVLGKTPLKDVKPFAIEKIKKNVLDAGRSPRTLEYVLLTVKVVLDMAKQDGYTVKGQPTKEVKVPQVDNKRIKFLDHNEADTLLNALQVADHLVHDMALLSLHTGMRFGEVASLKWGHIDIDRGIINVMDTKNKKNRIAFMTEKIKVILGAMTLRGPDDYVFINKKGKRLEDTPIIFANVVKGLGFNNGIVDRRQKVCFHSLRHTFASWHIEGGTDLYTLKELLGHSTIKMTERYTHLSKAAFHNATANFEKVIGLAQVVDLAAGGAANGKA